MGKETAVAKTQQATLAKYGDDLMDAAPVSAAHILIPKLLLMQPISAMVTDEKARSGEIRGSLDANIICEKDSTVEVVLFSFSNTWIKFKKTKGKPEFISEVPKTIDNALLEREETIDGEDYINYESINYYALTVDDLAKEQALPYGISFRSTSFKTGKKLETCRARLQEFRKPLPFKTFKLGTEFRENDQGKFYVFTAEEGRDSTDAELDKVKYWHSQIKAGSVTVDDSDLSVKTEAKVSEDTGPREY